MTTMHERFWSKVDKESGVFGIDGTYPTECWVWTAGRYTAGYGAFNFLGKTTCAHRASYYISTGYTARGLDVCHKCDNPACVRPSHLFAAAHRENMLDASRKGRIGRKGPPALEHNRRVAKARRILDDTQVRAIRMLANGGWTQCRISKLLGASQALVSMVVNGKRYADVL